MYQDTAEDKDKDNHMAIHILGIPEQIIDLPCFPHPSITTHFKENDPENKPDYALSGSVDGELQFVSFMSDTAENTETKKN